MVGIAIYIYFTQRSIKESKYAHQVGLCSGAWLIICIRRIEKFMFILYNSDNTSVKLTFLFSFSFSEFNLSYFMFAK